MKLGKRLIYTLILVLLITSIASSTFSFGAGKSDGVVTTSQVKLTNEEEKYIKENPSITIAMDSSWIPYCYSTDSGESVDGILPNLYRTIATKVGLDIKFKIKDSYLDAINTCKAGETMLVSGIANDTQMAEKNDINITNPYIQIYYSAVTKEATDNILNNNTNYKVAVCRGSYSTMAMKKKMPLYEFKEYASNEECMDAVLDDKVDIALIATHAADYYCIKHKYDDLHNIMIDGFTWGLSIGLNKDCSPTLISILNKGIAAIESKEYSQALSSGIINASADNKSAVDYVYEHPFVGMCIAVLLVALLLIILFLLVLRVRTRKQNEELAIALKDAEIANKSKSEFLSRVSHDMRTPMNGILGLSYIMEDQTDIDKLKEDIPKLRESAEYLLQLINDVLDVNRSESGKFKLRLSPCDEKQLFDSIIEIVKPQMDEKDIDFNFSIGNVTWAYANVDEQRVKEIFVNLLGNAAKFTPDGGKIDLVMDLVSIDDYMARYKFIINDTGIGMSEDFLPKLFQPFEQENRLEQSLGGTGLGLAIVKELIALMGGNIEVKSQLNEGTEFTFCLDFALSTKEAYEQRKEELDSGVEMPENLNILLCEDHPLNAQIAMKLLEKRDANVTLCENGKIGVETFTASDINHFDVILMDVRMPVMDGLETAREIRALDRVDAKTVPIIAMTANAYAEDVEAVLKAGMDAHLAKPIKPLKLYSIIANNLRKE